MGESRRAWALGILITFAILTAGKAVLNFLFDDFKGAGENASRSADEARRRGILVSELAANPAEVEVAGGQIKIGLAWLEERSLRGHRLVWFPAEIRQGGYRIIFTAEVPEPDRTLSPPGRYFFIAEGRQESATEGWADGKNVYTVEVNWPDISGLRLSAVRSWNEPRLNNIRFVPKR